jgi:hypothetical protein
VTEAEVKYTFIGETVIYSIKTAEIQRIEFGSGRTQVFSRTAPSENSTPMGSSAPPTAAASGDSRNKVAILPFSFIRDGQKTVDEISMKVQNEVFAYMTKHAGTYTYQEPRTTTALLTKAGITAETAKGLTMDEICRILGVEYVMEGIVTMNHKSQTSVGSSNYNSKSKNNNSSKYPSDQKVSGSNYSTTTDAYETTLLLNIYSDKGSSIFSQERKSFFTNQESYRNAMEYLLKRTPLYVK